MEHLGLLFGRDFKTTGPEGCGIGIIHPTPYRKRYCRLRSLKTMKSMNSLAPASRAPGAPSAGMIISASLETISYSSPVKNCVLHELLDFDCEPGGLGRLFDVMARLRDRRKPTSQSPEIEKPRPRATALAASPDVPDSDLP